MRFNVTCPSIVLFLHVRPAAGAVVKTAAAVASASSEYLGFLAKGQLPPPGISLTKYEHTMVGRGWGGNRVEHTMVRCGSWSVGYE